MTALLSDLQKLENLLNSATNERQRKMYKSLLDKARQKAMQRVAEVSSVERLHQEALSLEETSQSSPTKKLRAEKIEAPASTGKKQRRKSTTKKTSPTKDDAASVEVISSPIKPDSQSCQTDIKKAAPTLTPSKSNQTSDSNNTRIFQAVGLIKCTPYLENDKLKLTIDDRDYDLRKAYGRCRKQFSQLERELVENGSSSMWLRVYPHIIHDSKSLSIRHLFSLVRAYLDESKYPDAIESFVFRGIWQYVSYCSTPVISIHRNIDNLKFYKRLSSAAKKIFITPQFFPVVWNAPVEPFVYDSERSKSEQMPRYFVEVRATFKDGQYTVVEMLNEPSLDIPQFIKPPRKNPKRQAIVDL